MAGKAGSGGSTASSRSSGTARRGTGGARASKVPPTDAPNGLAAVFANHGHDIWGIALVVLAVVSGIAVYAHAAGVVGNAIDAALGSVFGLLRYLAPLVMAAGAAALIRGPRQAVAEGADPVEVSSRSVRRMIGAALCLAAVGGLLHVAIDPPSIAREGLSAWSGAGGFLGGLTGGGLASLIDRVGAALVLVVLGLLGVTLIVGRPMRELASTARDRGGPVVRRGGQAMAGLFRVGDGAVPDGADAPRLYDYASDPESELASAERPKRRRAPKPAPLPSVMPDVTVPNSVEQLEIELVPRSTDSPWTLPSLAALSRSPAQQHDLDAITNRGRQLEGALAEHGVTTRLSGMVVGPTVTRYELELGVGVKVAQVTNLSKDIAYSMASPDVRIIAPIPGKSAIGVEVPNEKRQIVALGDILCSREAAAATSPLAVGVGRDIEGRAVIVDLAKMPHVLIAGQTGAGKSSCINSIMTSVLMRATPDDVRMILVDPKRVELTQYNRIPHLLTQVVTNPKKAANALAWAVAEMERRYELLEQVGFRDITGYNDAVDRGDLAPELGEEVEYQRLPLILIVVDELADLMMVAARDVEESINRIAAKARAVGLHLVIATQRPSVNVITGVIKANIPARFAFSVASATDSKVIMNHGGAERLVGKGDMLLLDPSSPSADRVQGCWVTEAEVASVVTSWREQSPEVAYVEEVQGEANLAAVAPPGASGSGDDSDDELLAQAMELVVRSQLGSTSMLQRKLKVGFARAGRLMDLLESNGVVGPSEGSKARTVLMSIEEFEAHRQGE